VKPSEYEIMIAVNTPIGFPHLVCGWPDEEVGITWDNYLSDAIKWVEATDEDEDVQPYKSFDVWKDEVRGQDEERDNLGFSHERCDLCGALAGDRHAVTALPVEQTSRYDYVALACCTSCTMYVANGDVPDDLEE
jgi:hypothetical protein